MRNKYIIYLITILLRKFLYAYFIRISVSVLTNLHYVNKQTSLYEYVRLKFSFAVPNTPDLFRFMQETCINWP